MCFWNRDFSKPRYIPVIIPCLIRMFFRQKLEHLWTHDHVGVTLLIILVIVIKIIHTGCQSLLKNFEFWDCVELCAKLLANYECCHVYKWNLICEEWQRVHSLFIASGTGNRSIRRTHQKPQELDAEATGCWTSEQSPIEKPGRLNTSFFDGEPMHYRGGVCVFEWFVWMILVLFGP